MHRSTAVITSPIPFDLDDPYVSGMDGVGYTGFKLTHDQRVRAAIDRIVRHKNRILKLEGKIADDEDLLESLGEDVEDLYVELGIEDPPVTSDAYVPLPQGNSQGPIGGGGGGGGGGGNHGHAYDPTGPGPLGHNGTKGVRRR